MFTDMFSTYISAPNLVDENIFVSFQSFSSNNRTP